MNWDDLRVFLAVARARNLAGAARALGVDRSTASRRVAALERALGARLFLRTREGLRLSAAGERLRGQAERVESDVAAIAAGTAGSDRAVAGVVRVATTEGLATWLVQQGLLAVREAHPDLVIELLAGNQPVDVARGEADVALRVSALKGDALKVLRVARLGFAAYASPEYVRRRGRPRGEADLAGHDVVVPAAELGRLPEARWLASRPGVRVAFRTSSMPALVSAAARGAGVAVLTRPWGETEPLLERLFDVAAVPPRPLWLVTQPDAAVRAAVRVVAARIAEIVARAVRI